MEHGCACVGGLGIFGDARCDVAKKPGSELYSCFCLSLGVVERNPRVYGGYEAFFEDFSSNPFVC